MERIKSRNIEQLESGLYTLHLVTANRVTVKHENTGVKYSVKISNFREHFGEDTDTFIIS
jgi:hypothetical protein